jgi:hypothetical protein
VAGVGLQIIIASGRLSFRSDDRRAVAPTRRLGGSAGSSSASDASAEEGSGSGSGSGSGWTFSE